MAISEKEEDHYGSDHAHYWAHVSKLKNGALICNLTLYANRTLTTPPSLISFARSKGAPTTQQNNNERSNHIGTQVRKKSEITIR